jgi:transposase
MRILSKVSHVGLDCHKTFSRFCARDLENKVVARGRLEHDDRAKLRRELARWPAGTPVILEGTFGWGWIADELRDAGLDPHLASSRKVAFWRETRGMAKSNKIDADLLAELWPQQPPWWEVWLAPQAVRDQREWLRYRMALVQVQTMTKNRIHAALHRHGILCPKSDLFGVHGRVFLKTLLEADEPLRDSSRQTLSGHLRLLDQLRRQIGQVTRTIRKHVAADAQAMLWKSLPGVGWVLAHTIAAEIGDIARFPDARHLASYALLAPIANDSGEEDQTTPIGRRVGHAGRRTLKWALIEASHGAVRKSGFFRAVFDRRTDKGKRDKNRGYIAVARHLCMVGYACVNKQRRYAEERPARPGAKQNNAIERNEDMLNTLAGQGQPDRPMAAALE